MTFIICLLSIFFNLGQPAGVDTLRVWNTPPDRISADQLGQFYMIRGAMVIKYDAGGDSVYSWSEPQTGRITLVDAADPMRVLLYQQDFNLVRILNNRLAPLSGPYRLDDAGITSTLAIASSRQGGFWLIDGSTLRLRHLDQQLATLVESAPLNLPSATISAGYRIYETGDQVLLLIPDREILIFDLFANLVRKIPIKVPSFNVYGNLVVLVYPDRVTLWKDPVTAEETVISMPGSGIREACLFQNKILIRTAGKVILLKR